MNKLTGKTVAVGELTKAEKERMWQLMDCYYLNVTPKKFYEDLAEKKDVVLLHDRATNTIRGFSTLMIISFNLHGQKIKAVFSGDTIIEPAYWGEQEMVKQIGYYFIDLLNKNQDCVCYWFLIAKGYKPYRLLPLYFDVFYPRYDQDTPSFEQAVLDKLARDKYGSAYRKNEGILRFDENAERLRPGVADVTEERLGDPNVQFFCKKNPGFAIGEELVCVALLGEKSFKKIFFRVIGRHSLEKNKGETDEDEAMDSSPLVADLVF
jgi:hypothetical protein